MTAFLCAEKEVGPEVVGATQSPCIYMKGKYYGYIQRKR